MRLKKVLSIIAINMICLCNVVFATGNPANVYGSSINPDAGIGQIGGSILNIIQLVALISGIAASIILGIKYMYSAPGDKAEVKKRMLPFIIGAVLVFGATGLVDLVYVVASTL